MLERATGISHTYMLYSEEIVTPLGTMTAIAGDEGLALCEFTDRPMLAAQLERLETLFGELPVPGTHAVLEQTRRELAQYFAAEREQFTIPLSLHGTPFQTSVWRELLNIPFGRTSSYDGVAQRIARPGAARAVGRANHDNRIAIIIPCHRVISANGTLAGYGGGPRRQQWLLTHEQRGVQLAFPSLSAESAAW
jgi:AraC family transcriptional regulator of adaptative response/methylated-DNA-[protein]-cysteine methyltransferase